MSVVGRVLAGLSVASCVGAMLVVATAQTAAAAPTDVEVSPALAPSGTPVTISGSGCTGPVDLVLVSFVEAVRKLAVVDTATATPGPDGSWSTVVSMPAQAAHVTATCDGSSAIPVVLGPAPPGMNQRTATMLGRDQVVVDQNGLVEGSLYRVVARDGTELGSSVVSGGVGRVVLPWTTQLTEVLALTLSPFGTGLAPFVQQFDVPLNEDVTLTPPVARRGQPVTVSGNRCVRGRVQIGLVGESADWYDAPARYPGATLTVGTAGTWSHTFPAPPEVTAVDVYCRVPDGRYYGQLFILGSLTGPAHPGAFTLTPDGAFLPGYNQFGPLTAYRMDGSPVPMTRDGNTLFVKGRPGKLLVLEYVVFGENANAVTNDSPRQSVFDLPGPVVTPPAGAPAAPRPATPRALTPRAAGAGSAEDPAASPAEIPATGPAPSGQVVLGLGLLVLGLLFQAAARGRSRPATIRPQAEVHTPSSLPAGSRNMNRRPPGNS